MQILSVSIREFGGLKARTFDFSDGLNLITGDNESGKSTLLAFLRFMLYGLPRRTAETAPELDRAFSRENGVADGSMTVRHGGRVYRIERRETEGSARKFLQVVDVEAGTVLDRNDTPERLFFGFPLSVFDSTCCVRQLRAGDLKGESLTAAVENLILSGDESADADRALDALGKAHRTLLHKNEKGGEIHRLRTELADRTARLRRICEDAEILRCAELELEMLSEERTATRTKIRTLEAEVESARVAEALERFRNLHRDEGLLESDRLALQDLVREHTVGTLLPTEEIARDLESAAQKLEAWEDPRLGAESKQIVLKDRLKATPQDRAVAETLRRDGGLQTVLDSIGALQNTRKTARVGIFACLFLALVMLGAAVFLFAGNRGPLLPLLPVGLAAGAAALVFVLRKKAQRASAEILELFSRYGDDFAHLPAEQREDPAKQFARLVRYALERLENDEQVRKKIDALTVEIENALREEETLHRELRLRYPDLFPTVDGTPKTITARRLRNLAAHIRDRVHERARYEERIRLRGEHCAAEREALKDYDERDLRDRAPMQRPSPIGEESAVTRLSGERTRLGNLERRYVETAERVSAKRATAVSPDAVEAAIADLTAELDRLTAKLRAITLAEEAITSARADLRGKISPRLQKSAADALSVLSDGRYGELSLSDSLVPSPAEDGRFRSPATLSGGTQDALYLALRFALADLLSQGGEPLPLFLDEVLAQLDDTRASALLSLLCTRAARGGQILLFTCHTREVELLKKRGEAVRVIGM